MLHLTHSGLQVGDTNIQQYYWSAWFDTIKWDWTELDNDITVFSRAALWTKWTKL